MSKQNKYNAKKVMYYGITFDSKKEGDRYLVLLAMEQVGDIAALITQPVYELQPKFRDRSGKTHRSITYRADFAYYENGKLVVEDVKGFATQMFRIKEKLFRYQYPDIDFRIVV